MASLKEIVDYCQERLNVASITDFPGAENGLQVENNGEVTRIGAAVDAGLVPFQQAAEMGVDLMLVHHGLYWVPPVPVTGHKYRKLATLIRNNIALYSCHLPLDCHPELGNNAQLAKSLGLEIDAFVIEHKGVPLAARCHCGMSREALRRKLEALFKTCVAMEFGSGTPEKAVILTGSGGSAMEELASVGADTLITGELKQHHFNMAQELGLNVYACGHYATEVFGVKALAAELSEKFGLPWDFIETDCPL